MSTHVQNRGTEYVERNLTHPKQHALRTTAQVLLCSKVQSFFKFSLAIVTSIVTSMVTSAVTSAVTFVQFEQFRNMLSFLECSFIFKMCFYSQNVLSFSKCDFILEMCFHFWYVLLFSEYSLIVTSVVTSAVTSAVTFFQFEQF